jgi:putative transposase
MAKHRFTEEQIINILKRHEQGAKVSDLSREMNVSDATIYKWISKYGGMEVSDARRLRALEDENRRLKHLVADLTLDNQALKALNSKNFLSPR